MKSPVLTPQLHAIFSVLVEEACGLHYPVGDRSLFERKLVAQAAEAGYESLLDYYYRLRYDAPEGVELRALVQALVVHETYFFRELAPLRRLVDHVASVIAAKGKARVWSAACSTGEEPLTVAMLLAERGLLDRTQILATDVSEAALARARSGRHSRRSVRDGAPGEIVRKYLEVTPNAVMIGQQVRESVEFSRLNLLDKNAIAALGTFDTILCRNVLIYFRDASIVRILEGLSAALNPDGVLAVGVSESLLRFGTALVCEERGGSFFYRGAR
ncbi:protein-glutamate O-methyltransferase CheR [soil metagenome]